MSVIATGQSCGMRCESAHRTVPHPWLATEQQQQASHERGSARETSVRSLITSKITGPERVSQRHGLMKAEAKPFAGDGIHAAGSIPNERDAAPINTVETTRQRHRTRFPASVCRRKALGKLRKLV